ncbi:hypothetical protein Z950_1150 [Sulfitobacter mediterraneus KCTC 32188]|nr:hypothetical protein Z950_1150 [Sulfitobacter mediterraneus KCTC 32188]
MGPFSLGRLGHGRSIAAGAVGIDRALEFFLPNEAGGSATQGQAWPLGKTG